jgi:tRNA pseudouridine55 synthase
MEEIIFIDKPKGITSYDVIRILKRRLKVRKIGHAGTLDPQATGLLVVGVGKGTKKLKEFLDLPKTYYMEVLLGKKTETGDLDGAVIEEKEIECVDEVQLNQVIQEIEGEIELPVPLYSAVKHKGIPLYKYARRGVKIEGKVRRTRIFYLKLLQISKDSGRIILKMEMKCSKGTYARSVGEELGRRLSIPATLKEVRRLKIGEFDITQARTLEKDEKNRFFT